jgi:hypothetical protein
MFKKLAMLLGLVAILFSFPLNTEARSYRTKSSDVYVKGYYRSDGTYVQPHYRSAPDSSVWNNYSCIDYGKCGTSGSYGSYTASSAQNTITSCPKNSLWNGTSCVCLPGYGLNTSNTECITLNEWCVGKYGFSSYYNNNDGHCYCGAGYIYNQNSDRCEYSRPAAAVQNVPVYSQPVSQEEPYCVNGKIDSLGKCVCNNGFDWNDYLGKCIALAKNDKAATIAKTTLYAVTKTRVNMRKLPSLKGEILGITDVNIAFPILEEKNGWIHVEYDGGNGWMKKSLVIIRSL